MKLRYAILFLAFGLALLPDAVSAQFTSSNLPIVIIDTDPDPVSGLPVEIPDDPRVLANMKIVWHEDGSENFLTDVSDADALNYDGRISIEIRGSSSQDLPKKPYGLTTLQADNTSNNNVPLLGMPDENDWVLNSLAFDPSLIRDYLSYSVSRMMGNYAPRTHYCEVVINGDYKGLYILQEKIKADSDRVNVVKITASDNSLPKLSGGYITKADKTTGGDPVAWWMPSYNGDVAYIHDLPKPEEVTSQQNLYINTQFNNLQTAATAGNMSVASGVPSIIDLPTFVDYMLSSELASNADSYQYSTFFHKDRGGKLRAGPIWDYNLTYGNDLFDWGLDRSHFNVWQFDNGDNTGAKFWKDLFDNATFRCYLSRRFHELTQPGQPMRHNNLVLFIDETVAEISAAVVRENERWSTIPDHAAEIENLKVWLFDRLIWMEDHLGTYAACDNVAVPNLVISRIHYNPATTPEFTDSNDQEFIEITNAGSTTADIGGVYFRELGISYQFPAGTTVAAGAKVYLAAKSSVFQNRYGFAANGQFSRNLSNSSQKLVLADAFGNVIDSVEYDDDEPWPDADGSGAYLQLISTSLDNALASSWTASEASLGMTDTSISSFVIFPNPAGDKVTVSASGLMESIFVFDLVGRKVGEWTTHAGFAELDLSGMPSGCYLLQVKTQGGSRTEKFVKR